VTIRLQLGTFLNSLGWRQTGISIGRGNLRFVGSGQSKRNKTQWYWGTLLCTSVCHWPGTSVAQCKNFKMGLEAYCGEHKHGFPKCARNL